MPSISTCRRGRSTLRSTSRQANTARTIPSDSSGHEAEEIRKAFEPYYETTLLSEATDRNLLYEVQDRLLGFGVFADGDVEAFAWLYFDAKAKQDRLYAALEPPRQRFGALAADEGQDFRGQLGDYVRLYAFLSQVLTFADPDRLAGRFA